MNKPWYIVIVSAGLGMFVYLASALWSAIFIVALPQPPDAILDAYTIEHEGGGRYGDWRVETEWVPIEFKNTFEEFKYYHNVQMRDRNRYWVYGTLAFGGFAGVVAFCLIPRWRGTIESTDSIGDAVGGAFGGVLVAIFIPMFLSWCLPPPDKWFPDEIRDIAETREREALSRLQREADSFDLWESSE